MPLLSINMAIPMRDNRNLDRNRESQIYILQTSENPQRFSRRKYVIIKMIQTILCIWSLSALVCAAIETGKSTIQDMLICTAFGALISYPLLFVLLTFKVEEQPIALITINLMSTLGLITIGGVILSSWWNQQNESKNTVTHHLKEMQVLQEHSIITARLVSVFAAIAGVILYIGETVIMAVELKSVI